MADVNRQQALTQQLKIALQPWHEALSDPPMAQQKVLKGLLAIYAQTTYGIEHRASRIETIADYRKSFPVITYKDCQPLIRKVMAGEVKLLLHEDPIGWAITRGTTGDEPKFIPMTPTDLKMRVSAARAMLNYVATTDRFDLFTGVNLNLNFPSVVGTVKVGEKDLEYGYSSGIYVKHVSNTTPIRSVPSQDEIDALGGGKTKKDWDSRFELAYQKCKGLNVTLVGGVAPTALLFGKYLRQKHGVYPKSLWKTQIMTLGSVAGINTYYEPALTGLYGDAAIREIYGATEGMFGQQMDEKRAWMPNYDLFFYEVQVGSKIKMLHEMRPGETGSLIVSTTILPRYKIGDLIRAYQRPYFRCIGREKWWVPPYHAWNEFMSMNLDRI
jgi:hypothetical protein